MSRTNPNKKKRRSANKTALIYTEGEDEDNFLKYLRSIYSFDRNISVKIIRGRGGSADRLVIQAYKIQGSYDRKIVVLDNDKEHREMQKARLEAKNKNIELFEHTPCLEALLLSILNEGKNFSKKTSKWCKNTYKSYNTNNKDKKHTAFYVKHFPKKVLNRLRSKLKELDRLVCLMGGNKM